MQMNTISMWSKQIKIFLLTIHIFKTIIIPDFVLRINGLSPSQAKVGEGQQKTKSIYK